ncbi:MAG: phosphatidylinositol-specific phospholipase C domain-containing protein, partial [Rivularia sp. (in: cyanobacteria)]
GFPLALCQSKKVLDQLNGGVRCFDLRPRFNGNDFYVLHGPADGPKLTEILDDIRSFFSVGSKETVILQFTHFQDMGGDIDKRFVQIVYDHLRDYLVSKESLMTNPHKKELSHLRGKIIIYLNNHVMFDNLIKGKYVGFTKDEFIYDEYADKDIFDEMYNDQKSKLDAYNQEKLFMLNWTLTVQTLSLNSKSVKGLTEKMASQLTSDKTNVDFFRANTHGKKVNIINTDYFELHNVMKVCKFVNKKYFNM